MVLIYGSCKLEAADRDADMDLICVAPSVISIIHLLSGIINYHVFILNSSVCEQGAVFHHYVSKASKA